MAQSVARTISLLYEVVEQGAAILFRLIRPLGIFLLLQRRVDEGIDELVGYPHLSSNSILPEVKQAPCTCKKSTGISVLLGSVEGVGELV